MPATSRGYRYPSSTDDVRPYEDIQFLATDLDTDITAVVAGSHRILGCSYTTAGSVLTSIGATELALAAWAGADQAFTWKTGYIYQLDLKCSVYNSSAAGALERHTIRLRKAVNSVAAQVLGAALINTYGSGTTGALTYHLSWFIANNTGSDLTGQHVGVTMQRLTGAGTAALYGDATYPMSVTSKSAGLIAENANLLALATNVV
jgi:hypothetical protein